MLLLPELALCTCTYRSCTVDSDTITRLVIKSQVLFHMPPWHWQCHKTEQQLQVIVKTHKALLTQCCLVDSAVVICSHNHGGSELPDFDSLGAGLAPTESVPVGRINHEHVIPFSELSLKELIGSGAEGKVSEGFGWGFGCS